MTYTDLLIVVATFIAASVEWVEAFTIILAVGTVKGWRSAFAGTVAALAVLIALILIFGITLAAYVPIAGARTVVGLFLLLFGLKWLYKAILRSSGLRALHDEAKEFAETTEHLRAPGARDQWIGFATSFNGVFLEGLEVVFIVIALGGLHSVTAASIGAIASLVVVAAAGVVLRHPLTRVPENTLKYVVGIMLTAFGTFFVGEGIGVQWWNNDVVLIPLIVVYAIGSLLLVQFLKLPPRETAVEIRWLQVVRGLASEVWGLFVDDGALAIVTVAALLGVAVFVDRSGSAQLAGVLLVVGVFVAMAVGLSGPAKLRRTRSAANNGSSSDGSAGVAVEPSNGELAGEPEAAHP
jgi:Ca2+/H+ antiporter, TMEM165/GDT1 family